MPERYPERRPDDVILLRGRLPDGMTAGNADEPVGRTVEHSIEDPFTGEITVSIELS